MRTAWNAGRLAHTPFGPYAAQRYEEGLSFLQIAEELDIPKGCVQNLCRVIGVKPRKNHTTNKPELWEKRLNDYVARSGVTITERPERLTKSSRILTRCEHGVFERPCGILNKLEHCCRVASKLGQFNPVQGKPSWNSGTTGISTGCGFGHAIPLEKRGIEDGTLYWIRYKDLKGSHFKLGYTQYTAEKRASKYFISEIKTWKSTRGHCHDVEQASLKMARKYGWRYSSSSTTELIHAKEAARFQRIVEVLWLIYPWDEPKLAKDAKLNPYHPAGHALQPLGHLLCKVRSAQARERVLPGP